GPERRRHPTGGLQLTVVPLAVVERERVAVEALGAGAGKRGGGIEATREQDDRAAPRHQTPRLAPQISTCSRGEKRKPCALHASTTHGVRAARSSARRPSGWSSMLSRGSAKRSARRRTSPTSAGSLTTNFHQAPRSRNARIAAGLIRVCSGTPEPASLTETFHWTRPVMSGGGSFVPEASTSMAQPRAP